MAFSVLPTVIEGAILEEKRCIEKTWPNWWDDLESRVRNFSASVFLLSIDQHRGRGRSSGKQDFTYFYFTTLFLLKHLRSLTYTMEPKFPSISIVFPSKSK